MRLIIEPGQQDLVQLDRFTMRVKVLYESGTAGWWACETIPIGTRINIVESAFVGAVGQVLEEQLSFD